VGETRSVVFGEASARFFRIVGFFDLAAVDDVDGAVGTHDRDFGGGESGGDVRSGVVRGHDVVSAAGGLARNDRDLRYRRLRKNVQQLRAVLDDAAVLLPEARQEARNVDEHDQRDVEAVAEAHETSGLDARIDVETPGEEHRLVGDD